MKKIFAIAAVCLSVYSNQALAQSVWVFDAAHSKLNFNITHLSISDVDGTMRINDASIITPKKDFTNANVNLTADVKSINTENAKRDEHLRSADFFETEKYPTLTFISEPMTKIGDNKYSVTGVLTMHGKSKKVTLEATCRMGVNPMNHKEVAGFKVTGAIKRVDFDISPSSPEAMLSNEVRITGNLEFSKNQ